MAAPSFAHPSQAAGSSSISHPPPLPLSTSTTSPRSFDRDPTSTRLDSEPTSLIFKNLPPDLATKQAVKMMMMWADNVQDIQVVNPSQDGTTLVAVIKFGTRAAALHAQGVMDGKQNMIVEMLNANDPAAALIGRAETSANGSGANSSGNSSANSSRQPSRYNGMYGARQISPPTANGFSPSDLPAPDDSGLYRDVFNVYTPIGAHLGDPASRVSGKSVIEGDPADDDDTRELLKDPLAFAENGSFAEASSNMTQRRATAPSVPITELCNLSINTTSATNGGHPGPSSLPPYGQQSAMTAHLHHHHGAMSPPGISSSANRGMTPYPMNNFSRHHYPPANPADQNPPCNTLYVGNLPIDTAEEELKALFSKSRGYKRLCFRTKSNGPMCFVEYENITYATKALHELYGTLLHNSVKGGIRLSFSKNPLGVRSGPGSTPNVSTPMNGMNTGSANGFATASGPPPGLSAPPGLGSGRQAPSMANGMANGNQAYSPAAFPTNGNAQGSPWPPYFGGSMPSPGPSPSVSNGLPPYVQHQRH